MRALSGTAIYGTSGADDGRALVTGTFQHDPNGGAQYSVTLLDHSDDIQATGTDLWGDDYLAGGPGDDEIWGELGDDVIQGDGYVDGLVLETYAHNLTAASARPVLLPVSKRLGAWRDGSTDTGTSLVVHPADRAGDDHTGDGDDYIEGNGDDDVIFGGLGQDDIVGDSSDLFGLASTGAAADGADLIFGGAGTEIERNDIGAATIDPNGNITTIETGHARDADVIAGDNAKILRLVGINGAPQSPNAYLAFNYDNYEGGLRIILRAVQFLDYTLGGYAYDATRAATDRGAADELHGEAGDDTIYGMTGDDVLFGEGQDDDLVGAYGDDWISGGTGNDGILGDDGRIMTSRNSTAGEPLYGIPGLLPHDPDQKANNGNVLNEVIYTPGRIQTATINVEGVLKKAANLTPFNVDPAGAPLFRPDGGYDDILFGGLGNDVLHGGSGDDAMSGAEALPESYAQLYNAAGALVGIVRTDYGHPCNPGDVLRWNPDDVDGWHHDRTRRSGEFALYDEYDPLRQIRLNTDGTAAKDGSGASWFLDFATNEGVARGDTTYGTASSDGDDALFGDLGNDWLVGGTGRDDLYGGYGNDLLNADDDPMTHGGLNDQADTHPSYEDRAYGGAGRDVLVANTGGDRLIDWVGEFNSYLVPFAPYGLGTVSRTLQPQLAEFLYALSASDGADPTRAADEGTLTTTEAYRNGEPRGELGVVRQRDPDWKAQTGGPTDPQAGNIPGGKRDVLRTANFNDNTLQGFAVDSGTWEVASGVLRVSAKSLHGDAVSVFDLPDYLPWYFEVQAAISVVKPIAGWNANAFIIFDYEGPTSFKFAGIDASTNKLVMGHRDATGWIYDRQIPFLAKWDTRYEMLVAVNGLTATLVVNNQAVFSYTYEPVIVDGYSYGLNYGFVGFGSNNSRGAVDNLTVQVLPPTITYDHGTGFEDGTADVLTGAASGDWTVTGGRLVGSVSGGGSAVVTADLGQLLGASSILQLDTTVVATSGLGGLAFDMYDADDLKFVVLDVAGQRVVVGHIDPQRGLIIQSTFPATLVAGTAYALSLRLKDSVVTVVLNDAVLGSLTYNSAIVDGGFGLFTTGTAAFDSVRIQTDDPSIGQPTQPSVSVSGASVAEGAAGEPAQVTLTVTLSQPAATTTSVDWATHDGTATAGSDYVAASGTLVFEPGSQTATITITLLGDTLFEADESFSVILSNPAGLTIGTGTGTVTITNDDAAPATPTVSLTTTDASAAEANANPGVFTISRSVSLTGSIVVHLTWGGTATYGTDYTVAAAGGTLSADRSTITLPDGVSSAAITVTPIDDTAVEAAETVTLALAAGTGYTTVAPTSGTVSIADNDAPAAPAISINDATVTEGDKSTTIKLTVTLSAKSSSAIAVAWTAVSGTAVAGTDFKAASGTVTLKAGATSATISISILGDRTPEQTETFTVVLSNPTGGATLVKDTATITINDNDGKLTATVAGPGSTTTLSVSAAEPVLAAALDDLRAAGLDVDALGPIELRVEPLAGLDLGEVEGGAIVLDVDAAGWAWSVDPAAVEPGRMDLYSVLLHEVGHLLGFEHGATGPMGAVMEPSLGPGIRVPLPPVPADATIMAGRRSGAVTDARDVLRAGFLTARFRPATVTTCSEHRESAQPEGRPSPPCLVRMAPDDFLCASSVQSWRLTSRLTARARFTPR